MRRWFHLYLVCVFFVGLSALSCRSTAGREKFRAALAKQRAIPKPEEEPTLLEVKGTNSLGLVGHAFIKNAKSCSANIGDEQAALLLLSYMNQQGLLDLVDFVPVEEQSLGLVRDEVKKNVQGKQDNVEDLLRGKWTFTLPFLANIRDREKTLRGQQTMFQSGGFQGITGTRDVLMRVGHFWRPTRVAVNASGTLDSATSLFLQAIVKSAEGRGVEFIDLDRKIGSDFDTSVETMKTALSGKLKGNPRPQKILIPIYADGHQMMLLVDTQKKQIEFFEPNGFSYQELNDRLADQELMKRKRQEGDTEEMLKTFFKEKWKPLVDSKQDLNFALQQKWKQLNDGLRIFDAKTVALVEAVKGMQALREYAFIDTARRWQTESGDCAVFSCEFAMRTAQGDRLRAAIPGLDRPEDRESEAKEGVQKIRKQLEELLKKYKLKEIFDTNLGPKAFREQAHKFALEGVTTNLEQVEEKLFKFYFDTEGFKDKPGIKAISSSLAQFYSEFDFSIELNYLERNPVQKVTLPPPGTDLEKSKDLTQKLRDKKGKIDESLTKIEEALSQIKLIGADQTKPMQFVEDLKMMGSLVRRFDSMDYEELDRRYQKVKNQYLVSSRDQDAVKATIDPVFQEYERVFEEVTKDPLKSQVKELRDLHTKYALALSGKSYHTALDLYGLDIDLQTAQSNIVKLEDQKARIAQNASEARMGQGKARVAFGDSGTKSSVEGKRGSPLSFLVPLILVGASAGVLAEGGAFNLDQEASTKKEKGSPEAECLAQSMYLMGQQIDDLVTEQRLLRWTEAAVSGEELTSPSGEELSP